MEETWAALIGQMLANAPDPNEKLPLSNREGTIWGICLTFLTLALLAAGFRLYVRVFVVREPGWDDIFLILSVACGIVGTTHICLSTVDGLGHHFLYLRTEQMKGYLRTTYVANNSYLTAAVFIKISLLLQYLRIFKAGIMRQISLGLMGITVVWGCAFMIVGWFDCLPPRGFWDRTVKSTCYGFGLGVDGVHGFVTIFQAHAATNLCLDFAIFMVPLVLFSTPNLKMKTLVAMSGVFVCGATVVITSAWRLYSIVVNGAGMRPYPDPTWYSPIYVILSCVEVQLAIICASMPIFWPMIEQSLAAIFVTYQVEVVEQRVEDRGFTYELEHIKTRESVKSSSASTEELTQGLGSDSKVQYSLGVDPLDAEAHREMGPHTHIGSRPKPKWEI
ncbi:hypothetical protein P153DRAFT_337327 [Dothidotthia symphoricarpi CBS 119687]|uniref:Rhodopsin domain-containing protein n=1 Tax=Dothidotthia symphoricarpi CBS 119687 TaxID=1392245 RepID=A0A6A6AKW8_9PLEO|nr:uncharacterized protein P153DRAFT_337327 [Dothidotthia symphoricarpi CBS 119687]KAF2131091.1 hypothetical protein P153DRAFT_337327 [Dothidotthia symphoricarpi CBS 119687]